MISLPFVPVKGKLACPSLRPFGNLPFGREWRGRAEPDTGQCLHWFYRASLRTSFVNLKAPHIECHWAPLLFPMLGNTCPAPSSTSSSAVAVPPASYISSQSSDVRHLAREQGSRRILAVAAWTVSALGTIAWLVGTHLPNSHGLAQALPPTVEHHNSTKSLSTAQNEAPLPVRVVAPASKLVILPDAFDSDRYAGSRSNTRPMPYGVASSRQAFGHDGVRQHTSAALKSVSVLHRGLHTPDSADAHRVIAASLESDSDDSKVLPSISPSFDWSPLTHRRLTDAPEPFNR